METHLIVISCLTYQIFLLYFGRSCLSGTDIEYLLMFSEQRYDPRNIWVMGCSSYAIGPTVIQVSENGQKIFRMRFGEPM
jgi:hypothetical protein